MLKNNFGRREAHACELAWMLLFLILFDNPILKKSSVLQYLSKQEDFE